jgi:hypothetical protein
MANEMVLSPVTLLQSERHQQTLEQLRALQEYVSSVLAFETLKHCLDVKRYKGKIAQTKENNILTRALRIAGARLCSKANIAFDAGWWVPEEHLNGKIG